MILYLELVNSKCKKVTSDWTHMINMLTLRLNHSDNI